MSSDRNTSLQSKLSLKTHLEDSPSPMGFRPSEIGLFCLLIALMALFKKLCVSVLFHKTTKGEKEAEGEQQDMLGCHQGLDASQMELPCLLLRPRGIHHHHHHVCLPKPLVLLGYQFALCTSKDTLTRKELAFPRSLLDALIFLEGVFCEH